MNYKDSTCSKNTTTNYDTTNRPDHSKSIHKLRQVKNQDLLDRTKTLVLKERDLAIQVIHHLCEIQRRRLFASLGYSSLFVYCCQHLGYSEGQAHRRIATMKLIDELPEVEDKIQSGKISMTNVAMAACFVRREAKQQAENRSPETKPLKNSMALISELEGKTTKEAQRILLGKSAAPEKHIERAKPVSAEYTEIKFAASKKLMKKLERLREVNPKSAQSYADLIDLALDMALDKVDPLKKAERAQTRAKNTKEHSSKTNSRACAHQPNELPSMEATADKVRSESKNTFRSNRQISATTKHYVWMRDQGMCQHQDPTTGKKCGSKYRLEIDHIVPVAKGGSNSADNLQLTCRAHNQWRAIEVFGTKQMSTYFLGTI
jgi:5-methylcytosine-specific restriction endonuclease McrA